MSYLLDTCILLWWLDDVKQLKKSAQKVLADINNALFVSSASIWEIAIKKRLGRIQVPANFLEVIIQNQIQLLDISAQDALLTADLPDFHQDPFDRILIAQAKNHQLILIARDKVIPKYPIKTMLG